MINKHEPPGKGLRTYVFCLYPFPLVQTEDVNLRAWQESRSVTITLEKGVATGNVCSLVYYYCYY